MEEILLKVFEESAITGAFLYLLHHFLGKNAKQMEYQSDSLVTVSDTLSSVSDTLFSVGEKMEEISETIVNMDKRLTKLEERG